MSPLIVNHNEAIDYSSHEQVDVSRGQLSAVMFGGGDDDVLVVVVVCDTIKWQYSSRFGPQAKYSYC